MKRCFGYVRVSTAKQGEGVSLDAQREAIQAFAARNNLTITNWFSEKETAAKSGRPIFEAMIKALRKGKADGLVMHKIDRSARNFADWAKIGELSDIGIDVHFATETLDFRSRGGRLSADIQAVIAADYIRNLREETKKGINGRLKQGLYPFQAPIGYRNNGGGKPKTADHVRAPFIRLAFELYAGGQYSIRALVPEMEWRGLRNKYGNPVSKCGLETILGNPFYIGLIHIRRTGATYEGVHEPLIPVSLFDQVQNIKSGKAVKKVTRHNHTYRCLFRCGLCDTAMIPSWQKGHVYYCCQTTACLTKTIREEALEAAITQTLLAVELNDTDLARLESETNAWFERRQQNDQSQVHTAQLAQINGKQERLTDALIDRLIDTETFNSRKEALMVEHARIVERQTEATKAAASPDHIRKFLELIKNLAATYILAKPTERREIVNWATSNRKVIGKNIELEPANWLVKAQNAATDLIGAPDRSTSRRLPDVRDTAMEQLLMASREAGPELNGRDGDRKKDCTNRKQMNKDSTNGKFLRSHPRQFLAKLQ